VDVPEPIRQECIERAMAASASVGHRGDYMLAYAARAHAARAYALGTRDGPASEVTRADVDSVADLVLGHRRAAAQSG
jgi:hypothetical protein